MMLIKFEPRLVAAVGFKYVGNWLFLYSVILLKVVIVVL